MSEIVKIKDRDLNTEYLKMALNTAGIPLNYQDTEIIKEIYQKVEKLGGDYSVKDSVEICHRWKNKWDKYFKELENEKS